MPRWLKQQKAERRPMIIEYRGKRPTIGRNVFIAPTATVIGDVIIGDGASVWFGAVVREGQEVGPHQLVAGTPAVFKKDLRDISPARVKGPIEDYLMLARSYQSAKVYLPRFP